MFETFNSNGDFLRHGRRFGSLIKANPLMSFRKIISAYCEDGLKHVNTPYGRKAKCLNFTAGGSYSYGCDLKGSNSCGQRVSQQI